MWHGQRFARPPTGNLRWEPPVPFIYSGIQNATSLGPSCFQQVPSSEQAIFDVLPVVPENEDCLFL
jgi:carboxylesterase type B